MVYDHDRMLRYWIYKHIFTHLLSTFMNEKIKDSKGLMSVYLDSYSLLLFPLFDETSCVTRTFVFIYLSSYNMSYIKRFAYTWKLSLCG